MANGTRQPHSRMASSGRPATSRATELIAARLPSVAPMYRKLEKNPRRPSGADSTRKVEDAANSPPVESPCRSRASTRIMGESTPTWS